MLSELKQLGWKKRLFRFQKWQGKHRFFMDEWEEQIGQQVKEKHREVRLLLRSLGQQETSDESS